MFKLNQEDLADATFFFFFLQIQGTFKNLHSVNNCANMFGHHICPVFGMWSEKAEKTTYNTTKAIRTPSKIFQQHTRLE